MGVQFSFQENLLMVEAIQRKLTDQQTADLLADKGFHRSRGAVKKRRHKMGCFGLAPQEKAPAPVLTSEQLGDLKFKRALLRARANKTETFSIGVNTKPGTSRASLRLADQPGFVPTASVLANC